MANESVIYIRSSDDFQNAAVENNWTGNGTVGNPYIIENLTIDGTGYYYCIFIGWTSDYYIIRNCTLGGANATSSYMWKSTCIHAYAADNGIIENNTFKNDTRHGIALYGSDLEIRNNTFFSFERGVHGQDSRPYIHNNTFYGNNSYGIRLLWKRAIIEDNRFIGLDRARTGIHAYNLVNYTIRGNSFIDFGGIYSETNNDLTEDIESYSIFDNSLDGKGSISISAAYNVSVIDNTVNSTGDGIVLSFVRGAILRNNTLNGCGVRVDGGDYYKPYGYWSTHEIGTSNTIDGVPILYLVNESDREILGNYSELILVLCDNITVTNKTSPSYFYGIFAYFSNGTIFTDNRLGTNTRSYIQILRSNDCQVINNGLDRECSVRLSFANDCIFKNNTYNSSTFEANRALRLVCENNTWRNVQYYVFIRGCDGALLADNLFEMDTSSAESRAMIIEDCVNLVMAGNRITGGAVIVQAHDKTIWGTQTWDGNNTKDGQVILYGGDLRNATISGDYGQVILGNCSGVEVRGLDPIRCSYAVMLDNCDNITVSNCTFNDSIHTSLYAYKTKGLMFHDNILNGGGGILDLWYVTDSIVEHNVFENMTIVYHFGEASIEMDTCKDVSIRYNRFNHINESALYIDSCEDCIITRNDFQNCTNFAIETASGNKNNLIYLNNFIDNRRDPVTGLYTWPQGLDFYGKERWDNGTYGNYWSNYQTLYPNATNDGVFWNQSYQIWGSILAKDNLPLVSRLEFVTPVAFPGENITIEQWETATFNGSGWDNAGIVNYSWSFSYGGSPITLYGNSTSFRFDLAGEYIVTFKVTDASGNWDSAKLRVTVLDIESPVSIPGDNMTVPQETNVIFNGTLSTDNVGIANYTWSFEYRMEVHELFGPVTNFTFDTPGVYNVSLKVTDLSGNSNEARLVLTVLDTEPPRVALGGDLTIDQNQTVRFSATDSSDNVGIVMYDWTIESNVTNTTYSSGLHYNHTFDVPGVYTVTLRVYDAAGNWAEVSVNVTVRDIEPPVSVAGEDQVVDQGTSVVFDGTGSTDNVGVVNYTWTFFYEGGWVTLQGSVRSHVFDIPGLYRIYLNVSDEAGSYDIDYFQLTVLDTEPPRFELGSDLEIDQGTTLRFSAVAATDNVAVAAFNWSILSGSSQPIYNDQVEFNHTFEEPGVFTVQLNISDEAGNWFVDSITVTVLDIMSPVAVIDGEFLVDQGTTVVFDGANSTDNVGISVWKWTFSFMGVDEEKSGVRVEYTFDLAGIHTVMLEVWDTAGNTANVSVQVEVLDIEAPIADGGDDIVIDQHGTVSFDASRSSDNVGITRWTWELDHGDGKLVLHGESPSFRVDDAGTYVVTLTVSDAAGNTATDILLITVRDVDPPIADAGANVRTNPHVPVTLDGSSSRDNVEVVGWVWNIDGPDMNVTISGESPTVMFKTLGTFEVTLTVLDAMGHSDTDAIEVTVGDWIPPTADAGPDVEVDQDETVVLDGTGSSDDVEIVLWKWGFLYGGELVELPGSSQSFVFGRPGEYIVQLTVEDIGGNAAYDTLTVVVRDVTPPVADPGTDLEIDQHETVTFDGSLSGDNVEVTAWIWSFEYHGAQVRLQGAIQSFTFDDVGTFPVTLTVSDPAGLEDVATINITVRDADPPMAVVPADMVLTVGESAILNGSSSTDNVGIVHYRWTIEKDDSRVSYDTMLLNYMFPAVGSYNVTLTVTDAAGLADVGVLKVTVEPLPEDDDQVSGFPWTILLVCVVVASIVGVGFIMFIKRR